MVFNLKTAIKTKILARIPVRKTVIIDRLLMIRWLGKELSPGSVLVEVGAGTGAFSRKFADDIGIPPANVHLVEAAPETFQRMTESNPGFQCHHYAVAALSGTLEIHVATNSKNALAWKSTSVFGEIMKEKFGKDVRSVSVPAVSLTDFYKQQALNCVDLLMLNCEGAEYEIFDGDLTFMSQTRLIWLEFHGRSRFLRQFIPKRYKIYDLFEANGFVCIGGSRRDNLDDQGHIMNLWERV